MNWNKSKQVKKLYIIALLSVFTALIGCKKAPIEPFVPPVTKGPNTELAIRYTLPGAGRAVYTKALGNLNAEFKVAKVTVLGFSQKTKTLSFVKTKTTINEHSGEQMGTGTFTIIMPTSEDHIDLYDLFFIANSPMTDEELKANLTNKNFENAFRELSVKIDHNPIEFSDEKPCAMSAYLKDVQIGASTDPLKLEFVRAFARIDIGFNYNTENQTWAGFAGFELAEVFVYGALDSYSPIFNPNRTEDDYTSMPTNKSSMADPIHFLRKDANVNALDAPIYLPEIDYNKLNPDYKKIIMVVGVDIASDLVPVRKYFKIKLLDPSLDYKNLFRNFRYQANIKKLPPKSYMFDTPESAYNSTVDVNVEVEFKSWNEENILNATYNGRYYLGVEVPRVRFSQFGQWERAPKTSIKVVTNYAEVLVGYNLNADWVVSSDVNGVRVFEKGPFKLKCTQVSIDGDGNSVWSIEPSCTAAGTTETEQKTEELTLFVGSSIEGTDIVSSIFFTRDPYDPDMLVTNPVTKTCKKIGCQEQWVEIQVHSTCEWYAYASSTIGMFGGFYNELHNESSRINPDAPASISLSDNMPLTKTVYVKFNKYWGSIAAKCEISFTNVRGRKSNVVYIQTGLPSALIDAIEWKAYDKDGNVLSSIEGNEVHIADWKPVLLSGDTGASVEGGGSTNPWKDTDVAGTVNNSITGNKNTIKEWLTGSDQSGNTNGSVEGGLGNNDWLHKPGDGKVNSSLEGNNNTIKDWLTGGDQSGNTNSSIEGGLGNNDWLNKPGSGTVNNSITGNNHTIKDWLLGGNQSGNTNGSVEGGAGNGDWLNKPGDGTVNNLVTGNNHTIKDWLTGGNQSGHTNGSVEGGAGNKDWLHKPNNGNVNSSFEGNGSTIKDWLTGGNQSGHTNGSVEGGAGNGDWLNKPGDGTVNNLVTGNNHTIKDWLTGGNQSGHTNGSVEGGLGNGDWLHKPNNGSVSSSFEGNGSTLTDWLLGGNQSGNTNGSVEGGVGNKEWLNKPGSGQVNGPVVGNGTTILEWLQNLLTGTGGSTTTGSGQHDNKWGEKEVEGTVTDAKP